MGAVARPRSGSRARGERVARRTNGSSEWTGVAEARAGCLARRARQAAFSLKKKDGERRAAAHGPATTPTAEEKRKEEKKKRSHRRSRKRSAAAARAESGSDALGKQCDGESGSDAGRCATKDVERAVACCRTDRYSTRGANSTKFDDEMEVMDGVTIFRSLVDDDPIVATVLVIP
ncbi:hypothetical protein Scep_021155 [Stephania cephalantha]|uniref:Uncharacterized protein n=1 Tax=Stephania cephalantha TaxID=152367 RepID=A0AAP0I171_9MAGN